MEASSAVPGAARVDRHAGRAEIVALAAIAVGLTTAAGYALAQGGPLGWDEAIYAGHARWLATGLVAPGWQIYRPPGLSVLGILAAPFGFTDLSLRLLTCGLGMGALALGWAMTRRLWGPVAAIVVLLASIGSPIVNLQLGLFHDDLPSVGLLLALMLLLWDQFEAGHEPNHWLLAAAPLAAAAFYVRYGTLVAIGGIALTAGLLWHRPMRRHLGLVASTVGIAVLLVAPHVIYAIQATGSPLGIIRAAIEVADSSSTLGALRQYLAWLDGSIAGRVGTGLIALGLVSAAVTLARAISIRSISIQARTYVWLGLPAAITAVGLLLVSHAERRYMLFPLFLAFIVGGGGVATLWSRLRTAAEERGRRTMAEMAFVVLLGLVASVVSLGVSRSTLVRADRQRMHGWVADAGRMIHADAAGPCLVASARTPVMTWYSRCDAVQMRPSGAARLLRRPPTTRIYVVFTTLDQTTVAAATIASYRSLVNGMPTMSLPAGATTPDAEIYRLTP